MGTHLRDWYSKSYDHRGRSASSLSDEAGDQSYTHAQPRDHIADAKRPGQNGAPSFEQRTARCVQGPQAKVRNEPL
jgi:hypothetical protein